MDPFHPVTGAEERVKTLTAKEWLQTCQALASQADKGRVEIGDFADTGGFCARCRDRIPGITVRATYLIGKTTLALREYSRRSQLAVGEQDSRGVEEEELVAQNKELIERLRELTEENQEMDKTCEELAAKYVDRKERLRRLTEKTQEVEQERDALRTALEEEKQASKAEDKE